MESPYDTRRGGLGNLRPRDREKTTSKRTEVGCNPFPLLIKLERIEGY